MELHHEAAQRLRGRVAIVTGGGGRNSIGRSISLRFAEEGACVAVLDVDTEGAEHVAGEIRDGGGSALALTCDVSLPEQCDAAAACVAAEWGGRIDILVNNAAALKGLSLRPFTEWTVEDWDRQLAVNLRGQWACARAVFPFMKAQGYGKIINITSSTFWEGVAGLTPYVASKGGVIGFTRSLGKEVGEYGIRVNAIAPGYTLTEAQQAHAEIDPGWAELQRNAQALNQRNEVATDLAGPAVFFASDDSDFITCQTLVVDGGRNLW